MSSLLRVSEAASLALHTMVFLAARGGARTSAGEMADRLHASQAHLAKVLQRLGHFGLVTSVRGPRGGFSLARSPGSITLLEVYEAIEGPLHTTDCLTHEPICGGRRCLLGGLVGEVNARVRRHLARTRLSQLHDVYGGHDARTQKHHQD